MKIKQMYKTDYDVVIVGCGPSGATLANILRQKGRRVAVFDRDKEVYNTPRAMTVDGEACRVFQSVDVQERLSKDDARPYLRHIFVDSDRELLCEFKFGDREGIDGYAAAGVRFHQPSLERFLRDKFRDGVGVDTFFGYEVEEVDGEGDTARVRATHVDTKETVDVTAQFIVAADGGASNTRKYIGGTRIDFDYSRQWIVIDIILHDQEKWDAIHDASEFMCRPDSAVVFVKGFHNHVRLDFEASPEMLETFGEDDALKMIGDYIDIDPKTVEFQRVAPYHFYAGMPDKWRKGRVFIMGDAAHLTSPFSGQGLCMGIRDAANLGFKLDMVLGGIVNDRFLNTYQDERWGHCEKVIAGASERGKMISASTKLDTFKRYLAFLIGRRAPKLAMELMRRSSTAFPYEKGLVGQHKLAGHYMIQPDVSIGGGKKILMDTAIGDGFALLTLKRETGDALSWFETVLGGTVNVIGQDIIDADGKLGAFFAENKIESLIVRPDRYIFDAGVSGVDLCKELKASLDAYQPSEQLENVA